jgi:hypothetical protein
MEHVYTKILCKRCHKHYFYIHESVIRFLEDDTPCLECKINLLSKSGITRDRIEVVENKGHRNDNWSYGFKKSYK